MMNTPVAPFSHLSTLWIQVTGTWCNLRCVHCLNASGPKDPWLKSLDTETVMRSIKEAESLGVKEIYFTGGEPFLHRDILELLAFSLQVAPTTVLTNGTMIHAQTADTLAALEILQDERRDGSGIYERFRTFLLALGIDKPRVKIIPVFPIGRMATGRGPLLTEAMLQGFDCSLLQCSETRVVADGGVYSCPILAGLPEARLSGGSLQASFTPCRLYHPACVTCYQTGMTCKNF